MDEITFVVTIADRAFTTVQHVFVTVIDDGEADLTAQLMAIALIGDGQIVSFEVVAV